MTEERRKAAHTAEKCLISAALQWPEVADEALPAIQSGHFADARHGLVLESVRRLRDRGQVPSAAGVEADLEGRGELAQVGAAYLYELHEAVAVADHAPQHLRMVRAFSRLRRLAKDAKRLAEQAAGAGWDEADAMVEGLESVVQAFHATASEREPLKSLRDTTRAYAEDRAPALVGIREPQLPGYTTGLATLDRAVVWRPGQVYTLTAASGGGKSTLAWWVACQVARLSGRASLYFSIEMPSDYLTIRHLSARSKIRTTLLESGPLSRTEALDIKGASVDAPPVFIDDRGTGTSISVVERGIRQIIRDGWEPGLVVIDLLARYDLPEGERRGASRQDDVTRLVRYSATIASKYRVPVLNLSQRNREGQLRESDAPQHDSDIWLDLEADKPNQRMKLIFKKVRFGMQAWEGDAMELGFDPATGAFFDPEPSFAPTRESRPPQGGYRNRDSRPSRPSRGQQDFED